LIKKISVKPKYNWMNNIIKMTLNN
jgi:hypothetical protein